MDLAVGGLSDLSSRYLLSLPYISFGALPCYNGADVRNGRTCNTPSVTVLSQGNGQNPSRPVRTVAVSSNFHPRMASIYDNGGKSVRGKVFQEIYLSSLSFLSFPLRDVMILRSRSRCEETGRRSYMIGSCRGNSASAILVVLIRTEGSSSCWMDRTRPSWAICSIAREFYLSVLVLALHLL